jgi:hypothetical protein
VDRNLGYNLELEHIFICISDSPSDIEGYRAGFVEIINEQLNAKDFKSIITDQGIMTKNGLLFVSFTLIPK